MDLRDIRLHIQNMVTFLGSTINKILGGGGGLYDHEIFTLIQMSFEYYEVGVYETTWIYKSICTNYMFHIL